MTTGILTLLAPNRRREVVKMEAPDDVAAMLRLHEAGWGAKRIADELGCARNTVRRYLRLGGWRAYAGGHRAKALDGHATWVEARFDQHHGNAEVVRQELAAERGIDLSLRTVQRAVKERRRALRAAAVATVRFETRPGQQMQADFGQVSVRIGGDVQKAHLCVLTLGYSRRGFVRAFRDERQANWFTTMEEAFHHFGGVPEQVLIDNARALVSRHDVETGEVTFADRFSHFAKYWGFRPRACAPYRPRTKGKDESGVRYVKRNAVAGRTFETWEAFEAHLARWLREVSDVRVHGTTGERPIDRFNQRERTCLKPLQDRPPFLGERQLTRRVHNDACIEVDTNWYTVPWALVGTSVIVRVGSGEVAVHHDGLVVARHQQASGRRQRVTDDRHWQGLTPNVGAQKAASPDAPSAEPAEFQRSLEEYARLIEEVA